MRAAPCNLASGCAREDCGKGRADALDGKQCARQQGTNCRGEQMLSSIFLFTCVCVCVWAGRRFAPKAPDAASLIKDVKLD